VKAAIPTAQLTARDGGGFALEGELVFRTVTALDRAARKAFAGAQSVEVDLAGVTRCDSAALALLLEWAGRARRGGVTLRYRSLPQTLLSIAAISEVEELLPRA
jgi:phospholipid transport system transporter-binding protein